MTGPSPLPSEPAAFSWRDGERLIRFGRDTLAEARELIGEPYTLLTTPRAEGSSPDLVAGAETIHHVAAGRVDELAADLRATVKGERLVALGGGRVVDVAKALAAADPPRRVAAIPTTLSAAEMTAVHRHAAGVDASTPRVRPDLVINDPDLCASQPEPELAGSAGNSLGHAVEAPLTVIASPVPTLAALEAARLIARAYEGPEPDRGALALAALLSGYAIGGAGYGLHHVMSQTAVRVARISHGAANAILLPHTLRALTRRFPDRIAQLGQAIGEDPISLAARVAGRTGSVRLRELGVSAERLAECADAAAERAELHATPPAADRTEIVAIYEAAW